MSENIFSFSSGRTATPQLRRWCPIAETHQDADMETCAWSDCREGRPTHRLRLRRMLICSVPECRQGYFNQKEFDEHECYSAY